MSTRASEHASRTTRAQPPTQRAVEARMATGSIEVEVVLYSPGLCLPRHSHERAQLSYTLEGVHWSGYGRRGEACPPGTIRFLPPGEPHENHFPEGSRCLQITIHPGFLALAAEAGGSLHVPGAIAFPRAHTLGARLASELRLGDDLSPRSAEALILELLSAHEVPDPTAEPPGWLRRVADALHSRLDGRTPLSTLARDVGRHPVQVSRQFHRHFGCTMSTYLRRARVARAQELLVESHVTLAEVALRCGFSDQSHFTTVFHRVAGLPPHRYRERARGRHSLTSSE